ncbi:ABC-type antimicrobial peptide transport system, permease component MacB (plasmid) [Peptoclostridium acidaminophilum DSM 3953]|uniref:ABC-type antimicrobial peptide transport system, permease component MacB n=1 Tax=Peptoclostridium acidaminophilum DSM 3953 TaxID=1286171 RepID=W8TKC8_PEPAC|nr:ABC transporter permease [Peptoclostridium acidaminophilum]AHM58183.1 ABC-type antimicrobial peptide transport system, permease component MacB [Peptoclostridium acidaminophilum DSM 3953]
MNIVEIFRVAVASIWANKMRSFLTMLGIIIGIASVITIMALGQGSQEKIGSEFQSFGVNRIYITINWQDENVNAEQHGFSDNDIKTIGKLFSNDIAAASPVEYMQGKVKTTGAIENVSLQGVYDNFDQIEALNLTKGRFLKASDLQSQRSVAIIDKKLAQAAFKNESALGKRLYVDIGGRRAGFTVIGIYEKPESIFDQLNQSFGGAPSTTLYCPVNTLRGMLNSTGNYSSFEAIVRRTEDVDAVKDRIVAYVEKSKLRGKNPEEEMYIGMSAKEQMQQLDSVLGVVSAVIGAIAAISLIVGGIGIMNIMLVSVTERTREIGIRKAIGATKRSILLQFLVESMIISGIGGLAGTLLGVGAAAIAGSIMGISGLVNMMTVVIAVSFSCGVGIFFGIYPANKAAKMDPIEALRYE